MGLWKQYEGASRVSKMVGGPNVLAAGLLTIGGIVGWVGKTITSRFKNHNKATYVINETGYISDDDSLNEGDTFVVLGRDKEAVMIGINGQDGNVKCAKYDLLTKISNYKDESEDIANA